MIVIRNRVSNPFIKIALRMTLYGMILGAIAGSLIGYSMLLADNYLKDILAIICGGILVSILFGGSIGMIIGGIGGMFSGIPMMLATRFFFCEIRHTRVYRFTMGIITFIMTGLVFKVNGFFDTPKSFMFVSTPWFFISIISLLIAVQASQRAANQYLREIDIRKSKEKYV